MGQTLTDRTEADERVWQAVLVGDTTAFQRIVERYQGAVSGVALSIVGDFAASQDIAQEVFWIAWNSRAQLRDASRLAPWLFGITRNKAKDWGRQQCAARTHAELETVASISREPDPAEQSVSLEEQALVWKALDALPETYRETLILFYRQGSAVLDVAETLGVSEDAVKQRLNRGRQLLREQLAEVVEGVLVRTRPGRGFTSRVMAGVVGVGSAWGAGGSAVAASTSGGGLAPASLGAVTTAVSKAISTGGAITGIAGGMAGAAGGLAGAWLGVWLPARWAPTMTERRLLEQSGRRTLAVCIVFALALLALTPLVWMGYLVAYFSSVAVASLVFLVAVIRTTIHVQRAIRIIRETVDPKQDPNPTAWRGSAAPTVASSNKSAAVRRSYTSRWRLWGLPLVDVQWGCGGRPTHPARGWIACGDRAEGIVLGIGGWARGLIACGGIAWGGLAVGGLSVGLLSLGGLAVGMLAVGGGAIGKTAIGGGALGWDTVGGAAVGWHSAVGGFALARHVSSGGLAVAVDYAVGGQGFAAEVNSPVAHAVVQAESLAWLMEWYIRNQSWLLVCIVLVSLTPALILPLMASRPARGVGEPSTSRMPDDRAR